MSESLRIQIISFFDIFSNHKGRDYASLAVYRTVRGGWTLRDRRRVSCVALVSRRKPLGYAIAVAAILILYGIIPTFQNAEFGRVYAAYGGMFIVLSLLWGWALDGMRPDRFDVVGAVLCLVGMAVIMYAPRG